jgi:hypothetical protein
MERLLSAIRHMTGELLDLLSVFSVISVAYRFSA